MTLFKILVEFELDPTEYRAFIDGEEHDMPDTLESAKALVEKMFAGEMDICKTSIVGSLVCLFVGKHPATQIGKHQHQQILNVIVGGIQRFIMERPFQKITGPLSVVAKPPRLDKQFYEISVWRMPEAIELANDEPLITDLNSA